MAEQEKIVYAEKKRVEKSKEELEQLWHGLQRTLANSSEILERARDSDAHREAKETPSLH